ncbi:hypothetical protein BDSB_12055 [Burkholderia dolosa PC543]|nr:hypothetical protein BDSB_12055 [Burkholderia dolosa PC543]
MLLIKSKLARVALCQAMISPLYKSITGDR